MNATPKHGCAGTTVQVDFVSDLGHTRMCVCKHTFALVSLSLYMLLCLYVYMYMHACVCMCEYMRACASVYISVHV